MTRNENDPRGATSAGADQIAQVRAESTPESTASAQVTATVTRLDEHRVNKVMRAHDRLRRPMARAHAAFRLARTTPDGADGPARAQVRAAIDAAAQLWFGDGGTPAQLDDAVRDLDDAVDAVVEAAQRARAQRRHPAGRLRSTDGDAW